MLLHCLWIKFTATRSARNQLANFTVLLRLILIFLRSSVGILGHTFNGRALILVRTVGNTGLLFATSERILSWIKFIPLFAIAVTRR